MLEKLVKLNHVNPVIINEEMRIRCDVRRLINLEWIRRVKNALCQLWENTYRASKCRYYARWEIVDECLVIESELRDHSGALWSGKLRGEVVIEKRGWTKYLGNFSPTR